VVKDAEQERLTEARRREALKIHFEYLKHITTLGGATALVELAIYRSVKVNLEVMALSLILLAGCVGMAMYKMAWATYDMQDGSNPSRVPARLTGLYICGLALFVLTAVGFSPYAALVLVIAWSLNLIAPPDWPRIVARWIRRRRLRAAIVLSVVVLFVLCLAVGFSKIPTALVCDRGAPNTKVSSTAKLCYFDKCQVGPCVLYTHKSRPAPTGGGD
jgi:hypothetical protein